MGRTRPPGALPPKCRPRCGANFAIAVTGNVLMGWGRVALARDLIGGAIGPVLSDLHDQSGAALQTGFFVEMKFRGVPLFMKSSPTVCGFSLANYIKSNSSVHQFVRRAGGAPNSYSSGFAWRVILQKASLRHGVITTTRPRELRYQLSTPG